MSTLRLSTPLSLVAALLTLLAGCSGSGQTPRQEASPWRDGVPAYELYKTALLHYACLPELRYRRHTGDDPVPFIVLDTIIPGPPEIRSRHSLTFDTASSPLYSGIGGRDTLLATLGAGRRSQIAMACMPVDSVSDSNRYFVGFYIFRDYEETRRFEDVIAADETPASFGVAIDRDGTVGKLPEEGEYAFDVALGPNQIGTYISVRDYIATKEIIKEACKFTGDTLPLRVGSMLTSSLVLCDIDDLNDIEGYTAWHDSTHVSVMEPDSAILAEVSISGCDEVRDTLLHALSTNHGRSAPLVEFSAIDVKRLPGYRMLEAFIFDTSSSEPGCYFCGEIEWEEFMILDRQNRVLFAIGCPDGCGQE
jgi:hypothetical protein